MIYCSPAAGVALGFDLLQNAGAAEVFDVHHLCNHFAEGIQERIDERGSLVAGCYVVSQGGLDGMMADAEELGDLPKTHLRILRLECFDRDPIFHSNHLSFPPGSGLGITDNQE